MERGSAGRQVWPCCCSEFWGLACEPGWGSVCMSLALALPRFWQYQESGSQIPMVFLPLLPVFPAALTARRAVISGCQFQALEQPGQASTTGLPSHTISRAPGPPSHIDTEACAGLPLRRVRMIQRPVDWG